MASTKKLKGGKFKFKKKDGTWSKKSFASKSAALGARRASRGGGGGSAPSNNGSRRPGWGRWAKMARTIDVVSGPAQGAIANNGFNKQAFIGMGNRYTAQMSSGNPFHMETAKGTYGGIGTGLARDWGRSKLGVYRGIGQKKILSAVIASTPELLAATEEDPTSNFNDWNRNRMMYDRGYHPQINKWSIDPNDGWIGTRFWRSFGLDVVLRGIQHFVFDTTGPIGLNRYLGKGINA